jgi:hypothetical protein
MPVHVDPDVVALKPEPPYVERIVCAPLKELTILST